MITSYRANVRAFSTLKKAKFFILFSFIFGMVCYSHILVMMTVAYEQCGAFGIYQEIYSIFILLSTGLIPPFLSGLFGSLCYLNIAQRNGRIQPTGAAPSHRNIVIRRYDRDFINYCGSRNICLCSNNIIFSSHSIGNDD